jgi:hypothetical protein
VITGLETSGQFTGTPFVSFQYFITSGSNANKWIEYDRVHFNNVRSGHRIPGNPLFTVSGSPAKAPDNFLLNDAEIVFCGFASRDEVQFVDLKATMWLLYLNGGSFTFVPHAFSSGADTGESTVNAYIKPSGFRGTISAAGDNSNQLY